MYLKNRICDIAERKKRYYEWLKDPKNYTVQDGDSTETQKKKNTLKATLDRLVKDCKIESIDVLIAQAKRDQDIAINEKVLLQQVSDGKDAKDKPYTFDNYWDEFLRMKKLTLDEDLPVLEVLEPKKADK